MSNNNRGQQRDSREPQQGYQQQRPPYPQRQRNDQQPLQPNHMPPYFAGPHYPPCYPPFYPPNMKEDAGRQYSHQPMPTPYFYGHYPPYPPMPYSNYQQQQMHYPPPQHSQPNQNKSYDERGHEQRQDRAYEHRQDRRYEKQARNYSPRQERSNEQRQERNIDPRSQRSHQYRQDRSYDAKRKPYENRNNTNDRNYDSRNERTFEQRQNKTHSPHIERIRKEQQQDQPKEDSEQYFQEESQSDSQSEEVIYHRKIIAKRKDPILDSKEEIRKWIEARRRNYPKPNISAEQVQAKVEQSQMSLLEKKIRKKILLINADPRSMMKKLKDIDILRRFMLYSRKPRRNIPFAQRSQPQVQQQRQSQTFIQEEPAEMEPTKILSDPDPIVKPEIVLGEEEGEGEEAIEQPIKSEAKQPQQLRQREYGRREELSVDVIIKHLQMKQGEDAKTLENLMDYKSNSFHYRYQHQTLQTNLLLENIFSETSYILQAIRYIVKNNFFEPTPTPQ